MRRRYIVTYDIRDAKRLRKTFQVLRNYGDHLQLSVFECLLNPTERVLLQDDLRAAINADQDQVLFIDLGEAEGPGPSAVTSVGRPYRPGSVSPVVV